MFQENGDFTAADGLQRGVQYPFLVNEKVVIKVNIFGFTFSIFWQLIYPMVSGIKNNQFLQGNRRTPEKFVGKEAVITSQCLNGWWVIKDGFVKFAFRLYILSYKLPVM